MKTALKVAMIIFPVGILVLLVSFIFSQFSGCCMFYEKVQLDKVTIFEGVSDCFVAKFYWDGHEKEITFPDTYNKKPVNSLGGYFGRGVPTPFRIMCKDENDIQEMNAGGFALTVR